MVNPSKFIASEEQVRTVRKENFKKIYPVPMKSSFLRKTLFLDIISAVGNSSGHQANITLLLTF